MIRAPVVIGRWYLRPDGSARCPMRVDTREGWASVRYLQVMRRVATPRVQPAAESALRWWRWVRTAEIQEPGWWPEGIPRVDLAEYGVAP